MADYLAQLPSLIAHRGASAHAPENTLSALRKAAELGATWVEFDVMLDSRHQGIIFHDARLHRTTNGRGFVSRTPYSVIRQLDAGSWFGQDYAGEFVPTIDEWLQLCAELSLGINLEIKGDKGQAKILAEVIDVQLTRHWGAGLPAPLISSASVDCLQALHERASHYLLGYITGRWPTHWDKVLKRLNCVSLHVDHRELTEDRVRLVKENNYLLLAFTVNDWHRAVELLDMGVDAIFTDDPALLAGH